MMEVERGIVTEVVEWDLLLVDRLVMIVGWWLALTLQSLYS